MSDFGCNCCRQLDVFAFPDPGNFLPPTTMIADLNFTNNADTPHGCDCTISGGVFYLGSINLFSTAWQANYYGPNGNPFYFDAGGSLSKGPLQLQVEVAGFGGNSAQSTLTVQFVGGGGGAAVAQYSKGAWDFTADNTMTLNDTFAPMSNQCNYPATITVSNGGETVDDYVYCDNGNVVSSYSLLADSSMPEIPSFMRTAGLFVTFTFGNCLFMTQFNYCAFASEFFGDPSQILFLVPDYGAGTAELQLWQPRTFGGPTADINGQVTAAELIAAQTPPPGTIIQTWTISDFQPFCWSQIDGTTSWIYPRG